jgi:hypothetical protein
MSVGDVLGGFHPRREARDIVAVFDKYRTYCARLLQSLKESSNPLG